MLPRLIIVHLFPRHDNTPMPVLLTVYAFHFVVVTYSYISVINGILIVVIIMWKVSGLKLPEDRRCKCMSRAFRQSLR